MARQRRAVGAARAAAWPQRAIQRPAAGYAKAQDAQAVTSRKWLAVLWPPRSLGRPRIQYNARVLSLGGGVKTPLKSRAGRLKRVLRPMRPNSFGEVQQLPPGRCTEVVVCSACRTWNPVYILCCRASSSPPAASPVVGEAN